MQKNCREIISMAQDKLLVAKLSEVLLRENKLIKTEHIQKLNYNESVVKMIWSRVIDTKEYRNWCQSNEVLIKKMNER